MISTRIPVDRSFCAADVCVVFTALSVVRAYYAERQTDRQTGEPKWWSKGARW